MFSIWSRLSFTLVPNLERLVVTFICMKAHQWGDIGRDFLESYVTFLVY
jgi:hypothetical protein